MKVYNTKIRRNILYQYISSIELDFRNEILERNFNIGDFEKKAIDRFLSENSINIKPSIEQLIIYLDYGEYIQIIAQNKNSFNCDTKHFREFIRLSEKLIQIRNRVMHSRPLNIDDEPIIENFIKRIKEFNDIVQFSNVEESIKMVEKNPHLFVEKRISNEYIYISKEIQHNLPFADFEDTGFVGRTAEKEQLMKKIKGLYPVISIIGDGGIGKTSLLLSCLYDYLSEKIPYKRIIWTSLKTKSLQDGEFKNIKNSFDDFEKSTSVLNFEDNSNISNIKKLQNYMIKYPTLLAIDNLETINANDIKEFLEELPCGSKVIITSRIGIGEFEIRYNLSRLNEVDALQYFRKLVRVYDVKPLKTINDKRALSYLKKLNNSPLCIKWFIINVGKGGNIDLVLNSQDEIIDYCLSNVFNKLSFNAKNVLKVLLNIVDPISPAEIIYLSEIEYNDCLKAINELISCNFLEQNDLGLYSITEFSKKYLRKEECFKNKIDNLEIQKRINKLNFAIENLIHDKHLKDMNRPLSLFPEKPEEKIATIYMLKFIESSKKKNLEEMGNLYIAANRAAPNFSDIYKIAGYLYGKLKHNLLAIENFETALTCENDEIKRAHLENHYAGFLISTNINSIKLLSLLENAKRILPNNSYVLSNYARYFKYKKEFDKAILEYEEILQNKDVKKDDKFIKNVYAELLDIKIRKLDMKVYNENILSLVDLKEIEQFIDKLSVKYYSYNMYKAIYSFCNLLIINTSLIGKKVIKEFIAKNIKYVLYIKEEIKDFEIFEKKLNNVFSFNEICEMLSGTYDFNNTEYGKVISKKEDYFFISQTNWTISGVYCNYRNFKGKISDLEIGEYVEFTPSIKSGKRCAINVKHYISLNNDNND